MVIETRRKDYLDALKRGATQQQARASAGGASRSSVKRWRDSDPEFASQEIALLRNPAPVADPVSEDASAPSFSENSDATRATTRLRNLQADKLELDLKRMRGLVLGRLDVEEVLQQVLNRVDLMDGEANWLRLQRLYDVPYDESRDYWVPEIGALTNYLNGWLEDRGA